MKKTVYFILLSAATFLISCASNTTGIDAYTETLYKPSYASGFEIVGAEGRQSTLLKVFNPWQGAENTETTLFIVRNGEKIPAGFTGQVVKAGARRIVCLSSTHVAMLDALGQADRVFVNFGNCDFNSPSDAALPALSHISACAVSIYASSRSMGSERFDVFFL